MKKILSLVLALSMVLGMCSFAFASELTDIDGQYYEASVEALVELGIVNGNPDGTYRGDNVVTRAELAKMLVVALGKESAAKIAKGTSQFSDVAAEHWASGYINVAAQDKIVVGYPDGTFAPEATVTYAEAVTMALRALGYRNVVESAGTWPTNYITKASELQLLKNMQYNGADDGAKRGNVAVLLWNMLRTVMWDISEENQTNGMTYRKTDYMLNVKFPDYSYGKMVIDSIGIEDGEVKIDLDPVEWEYDAINDYTYAYNDFYTFVPGTEVEVLVNDEDEVVLMMVPTSSNKLVDGAKDDIDDDYDELKNVDYDYAYALIERRAIVNASVLRTQSMYIDELETKTEYVKAKCGDHVEKLKFDDFEDTIILKNGERVELKNLKEGDVLTRVEVRNYDSVYEFWVIGSQKADGELTKFQNIKYENSDLYFDQLIVSKEKYFVDGNATYVEDPDAKSLKVVDFNAANSKDEMEHEEVELILDDMFGKVVRVNFDGKIDSGNDEDTSVKFYAIVGDGFDRDGKTYTIQVENEDGDETYEFEKNSDAESIAQTEWANGRAHVGDYVALAINSEEKVEGIMLIADYENGVSNDPLNYGVEYGDEANEIYLFRGIEDAKYDKDDKVVANINDATESIKVNNSTIVVKLIYDNKGTNKTSDDEYKVEFVAGLDAVAKIKDEEYVCAIYDADATFERAKYILVWSDASDKSGNRVGVVEDPANAGDVIYVGGTTITVGDDEDMIVANGDDVTGYQVLVYTVTTNTKNEEIMNYVAGLNDEELSLNNNHGYVKETDDDGDSFIVVVGGNEYDEMLSTYEDQYEDYMIVLVRVTEDDDVEGYFEADSVRTLDWEDVELQDYDRISIDDSAEVIFIIRGMGKLDA